VVVPEGLRREADIDRCQSMTPETGKKINVVLAESLNAPEAPIDDLHLASRTLVN